MGSGDRSRDRGVRARSGELGGGGRRGKRSVSGRGGAGKRSEDRGRRDVTPRRSRFVLCTTIFYRARFCFYFIVGILQAMK